MTTCTIRGIPVSFPFEPYQIQKDYMEKVIECLQTESNGILESPTGTGKTLSLLCSSLAWLTLKKAQVQAQIRQADKECFATFKNELEARAGGDEAFNRTYFGYPKIIYSSRTHTQLSQAMQELKTTAYRHLKASVLGSREQMCVHPEIVREQGFSSKVHLCHLKLQTKSCHFYHRVDKMKTDAVMLNQTIVDIEDLVKLGKQHRFCPYYMSKELRQEADIVFMPYNYLLDPNVRKALGIQLGNSCIILDEGHNIEKICEDSASLQIKTTDITLCIEEVTEVMKVISDDSVNFINNDVPKDFNADELCLLKDMLLKLEKVLDEINVPDPTEGVTFEGDYIFDVLEKANINVGNHHMVINLMEKIIMVLSTAQHGPFHRKGNGLELLQSLLKIAFTSVSSEFRVKIKRCYKVHVTLEPDKRKRTTDTWLSKSSLAASKSRCKVLSYWCFSAGFGIDMLVRHGVKSIILTSGTLAPIQPLISELELKIDIRMENPHIVSSDQVCVKIVSKGPDGEPLICNYHNRDNPRYLSSLGSSILNLTRMIPNGLLIFFPSYPILKSCQDHWQTEGIWSNIQEHKSIFVEPRDRETFASVMAEYYAKIQEPNVKGAIFMGVCRGKVSEGLDFADVNGRGVIIVGLPYPPLKDPRVILKKKYLDKCHASNREYLKGDDWYSLEATRAVNQAIGRVIRHRHDYGAIVLLDSRFNNPRVKSQVSMWLRDRLEVVSNFGFLVRDIRNFFKTAETKFPPLSASSKKLEAPQLPALQQPPQFEVPALYKKGVFNFRTCPPFRNHSDSPSTSDELETVQEKKILFDQSKLKRRKILIVPDQDMNPKPETSLETNAKDYIAMVRRTLNPEDCQRLLKMLVDYRDHSDYGNLIRCLDDIFLTKYSIRYIIQGLLPYIKKSHKSAFEQYWEKMKYL